MTGPTPAVARDDPAHVVFVLLVVQAAAGLLAAAGVVLLMGGSPAHGVVPLIGAVAPLVLAGLVVRRRRWAYIVVLTMQALLLGGFCIDLLIGVIPQPDHTITLTEVLTRIGLPVALIWLCVRGIRWTTS